MKTRLLAVLGVAWLSIARAQTINIPGASGTGTGGGAAVSNAYNLTFATTNRYTNSTPYYADLQVSISLVSTPNVAGALVYSLDTNRDGTADFSRTYSNVNGTNGTQVTLLRELIPPNAAFAFTNNSAGSAIASITASTGEITYYATNTVTVSVVTSSYTNNSSGLPGVVSGYGIGTNLSLLTRYDFTNMHRTLVPMLNQNRSRVPPRVWGTWNDFNDLSSASWRNSTNVTERYIMELCTWWRTNGMRDAGWKYIVLEEGWQNGYDASGNIVVNSTRFPSGLTNLFYWIKTNGFSPGIYTSIAANGPSTTCEGWVGTAYTNLDAHFQQFANWGAEFVFTDACNGYVDCTDVPGLATPNGTYEELYLQRCQLIENAINKTGRQMTWLATTPYNNTDGRFSPRNYATHNITFNQPWGGDWWDFVPNVPFADIFTRTATNSANFWREFTMPGHYFYQGLLNNQQYTANYRGAFCLQAMTAGAMFIDSGVPHIYSSASYGYPGDTLTNTYPYLGIYANPPANWDNTSLTPEHFFKTNQEIAAIHLDPAVVPGRLIWSNGLQQVWWKPLGRPDLAIEHALLFANSATTNYSFTLPFQLFSSTNSAWHFRDVVYQTNAGNFTNSFSITVPYTNVMMYKLTVATNPITASAVLTNFEQGVNAYSIRATGTGLSYYDLVGYGDSPWFAIDGFKQSAANGSQVKFILPTPWWATNAQVVYAVAAGATMTWTNNFQLDYYKSTTREMHDYNSDPTWMPKTTIVGANASSLVMVTNALLSWTNSADPKVLYMIWDQATNSNSRSIIGPIRIYWSGVQWTSR